MIDNPYRKIKCIIQALGEKSDSVLRYMTDKTIEELSKIEIEVKKNYVEIQEVANTCMNKIEREKEKKRAAEEEREIAEAAKIDEEKDDLFEVEEEEEEFDYSRLAEKLREESEQKRAFFIQNLNEEEQKKILEHFEEDEETNIMKKNVTKNKFTDEIFKILYETYFTETEEDEDFDMDMDIDIDIDIDMGDDSASDLDNTTIEDGHIEDMTHAIEDDFSIENSQTEDSEVEIRNVT